MKKIINLIILFFFLTDCDNSNTEEINLSGNWSGVYKKDNNYEYHELYFYKDTMMVFNKDFGLHLPYKYKIKGNKITIIPTEEDTTYQGTIILKNKNSVIIDYGNWKDIMTKISDDNFTLDSLIKTEIVNINTSDSIRTLINNEFVKYFCVREIKTRKGSITKHNHR